MSDFGPKLLLVEGLTDRYFVESLRGRHQDMPRFDIKVCSGIDNLVKVIRSEVKAPNREALGVLCDANDSIESRQDNIVQRLVAAGIEFPGATRMRPGTTRSIEPPVGIDLRRFGTWLFPDNESVGELENLVAVMIPPQDRVWQLAGEYINGIPDQHREFGPSKQKVEKARVYAWLATRRKPGLMGRAVAKEMELDGEVVGRLVAWLRELFR